MNIPKEISEEAVKAADVFVGYCLQHAAFLGGRGDIQAMVESFNQIFLLHYIVHCIMPAAPAAIPNAMIGKDHTVAAYCLLLPGKTLHISSLLAAKRFRDRGNKDGAVRAIRLLEKEGLGAVIERKPARGTSLVYIMIIMYLVCNIPCMHASI